MRIPEVHILQHTDLNRHLSEKGYVVIPLLNANEVSHLVDFFTRHHPVAMSGFYATAHVADTSFRQMMSAYIREIIAPAVSRYFINYTLLGGSYIAKAAGEQGILQPHQDWNIVDETQYRSYNIWIPLTDLNEHNGAIRVMPGSHRWLMTYRHASIPCAFRQVYPIIWQHALPLYLKAGEALLYDHALLHASGPNNTNQLRIACACGIIPSAANMVLYYNNNGTVEEYACSSDYFLQENIFDRPKKLRKIRTVPYDFPVVNEQSVYELSGISPTPCMPATEPENRAVKNKSSRPVWKIYTPLNIYREIKHRLSLR